MCKKETGYYSWKEFVLIHRASLSAQIVKKLPTNSGDPGSIPGLGKSLGWDDLLEEEMATHSSILAKRIPWTEEPGRLQSIRSQRVDIIEAT